MIGIDAAILVEFCHCCGDGCDCGCVLDCRIASHRTTATDRENGSRDA